MSQHLRRSFHGNTKTPGIVLLNLTDFTCVQIYHVLLFLTWFRMFDMPQAQGSMRRWRSVPELFEDEHRLSYLI